MIKEDKELLLIDLCARLPYGVKTTNGNGILELSPRTDVIYIVDNGHIPYLRPMSSMTEEEIAYYRYYRICQKDGIYLEDEPRFYDWLNEHHLDWHELIEKGLAVEAPQNMYKFN